MGLTRAWLFICFSFIGVTGAANLPKVKYTGAYGGNGGGAVNSFCKSGKYINHWKVRSGTLVDLIQGRCNDGTWLRSCGGTGGGLSEGGPAWGTQKMQTRTGWLVDKFNNRGGNGGTEHWMDCGEGYRITGYMMRCGSLVDKVQMQCTEQIKAPGSSRLISNGCCGGSSTHWPNHRGSTLQACADLCRSSPYFTWVPRGDKNCRCHDSNSCLYADDRCAIYSTDGRSEAKYVLSKYNENGCPAGSARISASDCKAALNHVQSKSSPAAFWRDDCRSGSAHPWCAQRPIGCVQDKNGHLFYNELAPSNPTYVSVRLICKGSDPPHSKGAVKIGTDKRCSNYKVNGKWTRSWKSGVTSTAECAQLCQAAGPCNRFSLIDHGSEKNSCLFNAPYDCQLENWKGWASYEPEVAQTSKSICETETGHRCGPTNLGAVCSKGRYCNSGGWCGGKHTHDHSGDKYDDDHGRACSGASTPSPTLKVESEPQLAEEATISATKGILTSPMKVDGDSISVPVGSADEAAGAARYYVEASHAGAEVALACEVLAPSSGALQMWFDENTPFEWKTERTASFGWVKLSSKFKLDPGLHQLHIGKSQGGVKLRRLRILSGDAIFSRDGCTVVHKSLGCAKSTCDQKSRQWKKKTNCEVCGSGLVTKDHDACRKCTQTCGGKTCYSCNWVDSAILYKNTCVKWCQAAAGSSMSLCETTEPCLLRGLLRTLPSLPTTRFNSSVCAPQMVLAGGKHSEVCGTEGKAILERASQCFGAVDTILRFFKNSALDAASPVYTALEATCSADMQTDYFSDQGPSMMENALIIQRSVFRTIVESLSGRCQDSQRETMIGKCSVLGLVSNYNKQDFKTNTNGILFSSKCISSDQECESATCEQKSAGSCESDYSTCVEPTSFLDICSHRQRVARCAAEHRTWDAERRRRRRRNSQEELLEVGAATEDRLAGEDIITSLLMEAGADKDARADKGPLRQRLERLFPRAPPRPSPRDPCIHGRACLFCHRSKMRDYANCNMCARDCERSARQYPEGKGNECWYSYCRDEMGGDSRDIEHPAVQTKTNEECAASVMNQEEALSLLSDASSSHAAAGWNCG